MRLRNVIAMIRQKCADIRMKGMAHGSIGISSDDQEKGRDYLAEFLKRSASARAAFYKSREEFRRIYGARTFGVPTGNRPNRVRVPDCCGGGCRGCKTGGAKGRPRRRVAKTRAEAKETRLELRNRRRGRV